MVLVCVPHSDVRLFATIYNHVTVAPRDRLAELERQMVGGEEASNEEVRERHQLKIKHVEERKRKLQGTSRHVKSRHGTCFYVATS